VDKKSLTTDWIYYSSSFEFIKELPLESSAWSGHYFFAYDLVRNVKPKVIVELGTHKGNSLFSMAQAIKDGRLETKLHGIDTWEGDQQAGYYGEDVYNQYQNISKKYYKDVNIVPHKMLFDNAVKEFKNNSIDILHIDGLHTYEAVKHDFETWLPKVKKDTGIIMFHDVCETKDDFGVYKLWKELKEKYKNTITFEHYHGLGVIFLYKYLKTENTYSFFKNLVHYYTTISSCQDLENSLQRVQEKNRNLENNLSEMQKTIEGMNKNLGLYKQQEKVLESYKREAEEFRSFQKGKMWRYLSTYRNLKHKINKGN